MVAGTILPVGLENSQKVKRQELLGFDVTQRSNLRRVEGRNMKFSVQMRLPFLDSGKKNIGFGANVCGNKAKSWGEEHCFEGG